MLAVRATAVRDESVVLFVEAQRILDPTDPNIAPHLSLPHSGSLEARKALRPSRPRLCDLLYERDLSVIVPYLGADRLDQ